MHSRHFKSFLTAIFDPGRGSPRPVPSVRLCLSSALLICMAAGPASAQSASFRSVDTDRNGVLTYDELVAAFGREGANRLLRSTDHDGDGRITLPELRRGPDDGRDDDGRPGTANDRDGGRDDDRDDDRDDRDDGDDDDDSGDDGGGDDGGDDD